MTTAALAVREVTASQFHAAVAVAWPQLAQRDGHQPDDITDYTVAEYSDMRCFLSDDGLTGVAVSADDEIVSLFNISTPGRGALALEAAVAAGGRHLNCCDGPLTNYYRGFGFRVSRIEPNWTPGGPAVAYMELP